jgi:hypothetical protein
LQPQQEIQCTAPSVAEPSLSPNHTLDETYLSRLDEPWNPLAQGRGRSSTPGEKEGVTTPSASAPYFLGFNNYQFGSHASSTIVEPKGTRLSSDPDLPSLYFSETSATAFNPKDDNRTIDSRSTIRPPPHHHDPSLFASHSFSSGSLLRSIPLRAHASHHRPSPYISDADDDIYRCEVCGASFSGAYRRGNLGRHRRIKHTDSGHLHPCESDSCDKVFVRLDVRLKHYRKQHPNLVQAPAISRTRHEQNVYHHCTEPGCERRFDTSGELSRHQRTHLSSSERPHKCQTCGQSFLYPKDLRRHEVIHER